MENKLTYQRRSVSLGDVSKYTGGDLKNLLLKIQENTNENSLIFYLDHIRNCSKLTDEMIENIKNMNDENKMIIIKELNNLLGVMSEIVTTM